MANNLQNMHNQTIPTQHGKKLTKHATTKSSNKSRFIKLQTLPTLKLL